MAGTGKGWIFGLLAGGALLGPVSAQQPAPAAVGGTIAAAHGAGIPAGAGPAPMGGTFPGLGGGPPSSAIKSAPGPLPPQLSFVADTHYFKLPAGYVFGEVLSVAVNSKGRIAVLHHPGSTGGPIYGASTSQVLEFNPDGTFLREIGKGTYGFAYGHGVRYDRFDNLWVADKGSSTVTKFDPDGNILLNLGRREEGPDEHTYINYRNPQQRPPEQVDGFFNEPTDMAWDKEDNVYISDGYKNSRVAKFDKDGNWLASWGSRGGAPGQFSTVHNIGIDRNENVYVADRSNRRIQIFDKTGKYLREIRLTVPFNDKRHPVLGPNPFVATGPDGATAPWTICLTTGPVQYLFTSDAEPGRIYKYTLDGKLVGVWGESGRVPGKLGWVHSIACPSENELYLADMINWRVTRLTMRSGQ